MRNSTSGGFRRFIQFRALALRIGCNTIPPRRGHPRPIRPHIRSHHVRTEILPVGRMQSGRSTRPSAHWDRHRLSNRSHRRYRLSSGLLPHAGCRSSHAGIRPVLRERILSAAAEQWVPALWQPAQLASVPWEQAVSVQALWGLGFPLAEVELWVPVPARWVSLPRSDERSPLLAESVQALTEPQTQILWQNPSFLFLWFLPIPSLGWKRLFGDLPSLLAVPAHWRMPEAVEHPAWVWSWRIR